MGWLGSQGGCERRIKFKCENLKKKKNGGYGGVGGGRVCGVGGLGWN